MFILIIKIHEDIKNTCGKVFKCGFSKTKYNEKISVQEGVILWFCFLNKLLLRIVIIYRFIYKNKIQLEFITQQF